jgi:hypothetical protein
MKVVQAGGGRLATFTQCRAAFCAANMMRGGTDRSRQQKAWEVLATLVRRSEQNEYTYKARIELGRDLVKTGRRNEGLTLLRAQPKEAGPFKALADYFVKEFEKPEKEKEE